MMDLETLTTLSTQIGAVLAGCAALLRYVAFPSLKAVKKLRLTSEELTKSLPILLELAERFSKEGKLILPNKLQELQDSVIVNAEVLRALGNKLKLCWYRTDANGNYVYISNELSKLMGITLEQSLGNGWKNSICTQFRENVVDEWNLSIKEKREFNFDFAFCHTPTHKEIPVNSHTHLIKDGNEIIGHIGIVTPVDDSSCGYQN